MNAQISKNQVTLSVEVLRNPALLVGALLAAGLNTEVFAWLGFVYNLRDAVQAGKWDSVKLNDKAESWGAWYAEWLSKEGTQRKYLGVESAPKASAVIPFSETQSPARNKAEMVDYLVSEYGVKAEHIDSIVEGLKGETMSLAIDRAVSHRNGKGKTGKTALAAIRKVITNEWKNRESIVTALTGKDNINAPVNPAPNAPVQAIDMAALQANIAAMVSQQLAALLAQQQQSK